MVSTEFLSVPSSPPRQISTFDMSSSPPLPSLAELIQKKPEAIRSGRQIAPIPANAVATRIGAVSLVPKVVASVSQDVEALHNFMLETGKDTADATSITKPIKSKPLKTVPGDSEVGQNAVAKLSQKSADSLKKLSGDCVEAGTLAPKKVSKPRAKKVLDLQEEHGSLEVAAPRKSRAKKVDRIPELDGTPKEKPVRKPRTKKIKDEAQPKLTKGKVTKATALKSRAKVVTELTGEAAPVKIDLFTDPVGFGLANAVRRRVNWTPPPFEAEITSFTPSTTKGFGALPATGDSATSPEGRQGFTNLLGKFGFAAAGELAAKKAPPPSVIRKRKLVELVKTCVSAAGSTSPAKEKAPKKKPRTITEQATSAYIEEEESELAPSSALLLQYFAPDVTCRIASDEFKVPPKPRSKSPIKAKPRAKSGTAQAPILLSPESALKQARNQDYVFGTSSQLAREESPTLLRDLHEAMQASNEANSPDYCLDDLAMSDTQAQSGKAAVSTSRSLWSAAARDTSGELMNIETLDLVHSCPTIGIVSHLTSITTHPLSDPTDEGWHEIEDMEKLLPEEALPEKRGSEKRGPIEAAIYESLTSPKSALTMKKHAARVVVAKDPESVALPIPQPQVVVKASASEKSRMPDFSTYPTAKLEKEIKSYGFKPVKGRNQMIVLMEKCWQGKHGVVLEQLDTNSNLKTHAPSKSLFSSHAAAVSPKRSVGRPRKEATQKSPPKARRVPKSKKSNPVEDLEIESNTLLFQMSTPKRVSKKTIENLEEIEDSDGLVTPSPPRRHASKAGAIAASLQISGEDEASLSLDSLQRLLFSHISRAIRNAPPATDSQTPSWHEKILLFDPIILEDLTVWLNTGALEKVGWDGEVEPKEVKKWCESKSICCLWRENLRGGARSRY